MAVVWIEKENLERLAQEWGVSGGDLTNNQEMKKALLNEFTKIAKEKKLNSLEKIHALLIEDKSWMQMDLITNTFKKKRFEISKHYHAQIEQLY